MVTRRGRCSDVGRGPRTFWTHPDGTSTFDHTLRGMKRRLTNVQKRLKNKPRSSCAQATQRLNRNGLEAPPQQTQKTFHHIDHSCSPTFALPNSVFSVNVAHIDVTTSIRSVKVAGDAHHELHFVPGALLKDLPTLFIRDNQAHDTAIQAPPRAPSFPHPQPRDPCPDHLT